MDENTTPKQKTHSISLLFLLQRRRHGMYRKFSARRPSSKLWAAADKNKIAKDRYVVGHDAMHSTNSKHSLVKLL